MEIKATDVKKLREKTGAGMLDCKNALVTTDGDFDKAERLLKEQGLAAAVKKSERVTNAGMIFSKILPDKGLLLELTCETDFVARNTLFQELGTALIGKVAEKNLTAVTEELETMVKETVGKIKENMQLKRIVTLPVGAGETIVEYIHDGRIGVMIRFSFSDPKAGDNPKVKEILFDCALHAAAFGPLFLSRDKVSPAFLKEQEEIFAKQAENLNKPANVLPGIIKGKVNKMLAEICFLDQPFVKDDKRTVAKVLEDLGKEVGSKITIVDYRYVKLGEDHT
ncbi:MAG TPA: translation elongation factor Ts [Spirochaetia bacterium]|nr:translation elongation factor Ts [Spirochaetia bacterium]